jgi:E3 ubiquitin-protein ligase UBR7
VKDEHNDKNTYNHNFKGLYCICRRPYPDPEDEDTHEDDEDEMIQCVICEDWLHGRVQNCG